MEVGPRRRWQAVVLPVFVLQEFQEMKFIIKMKSDTQPNLRDDPSHQGKTDSTCLPHNLTSGGAQTRAGDTSTSKMESAATKGAHYFNDWTPEGAKDLNNQSQRNSTPINLQFSQAPNHPPQTEKNTKEPRFTLKQHCKPHQDIRHLQTKGEMPTEWQNAGQSMKTQRPANLQLLNELALTDMSSQEISQRLDGFLGFRNGRDIPDGTGEGKTGWKSDYPRNGSQGVAEKNQEWKIGIEESGQNLTQSVNKEETCQQNNQNQKSKDYSAQMTAINPNPLPNQHFYPFARPQAVPLTEDHGHCDQWNSSQSLFGEASGQLRRTEHNKQKNEISSANHQKASQDIDRDILTAHRDGRYYEVLTTGGGMPQETNRNEQKDTSNDDNHQARIPQGLHQNDQSQGINQALPQKSTQIHSEREISHLPLSNLQGHHTEVRSNPGNPSEQISFQTRQGNSKNNQSIVDMFEPATLHHQNQKQEQMPSNSKTHQARGSGSKIDDQKVLESLQQIIHRQQAPHSKNAFEQPLANLKTENNTKQACQASVPETKTEDIPSEQQNQLLLLLQSLLQGQKCKTNQTRSDLSSVSPDKTSGQNPQAFGAEDKNALNNQHHMIPSPLNAKSPTLNQSKLLNFLLPFAKAYQEKQNAMGIPQKAQEARELGQTQGQNFGQNEEQLKDRQSFDKNGIHSGPNPNLKSGHGNLQNSAELDQIQRHKIKEIQDNLNNFLQVSEELNQVPNISQEVKDLLLKKQKDNIHQQLKDLQDMTRNSNQPRPAGQLTNGIDEPKLNGEHMAMIISLLGNQDNYSTNKAKETVNIPQTENQNLNQRHPQWNQAGTGQKAHDTNYNAITGSAAPVDANQADSRINCNPRDTENKDELQAFANLINSQRKDHLFRQPSSQREKQEITPGDGQNKMCTPSLSDIFNFRGAQLKRTFSNALGSLQGLKQHPISQGTAERSDADNFELLKKIGEIDQRQEQQKRQRLSFSPNPMRQPSSNIDLSSFKAPNTGQPSLSTMFNQYKSGDNDAFKQVGEDFSDDSETPLQIRLKHQIKMYQTPTQFQQVKNELLRAIRKEVNLSKVIIDAKLKRRHRNVNEDKFRGSQFRGVSKNKNKWQMMIMINQNKVYIGAIKTENEAARLYDYVAIISQGLNAKTNFNYSGNKVLQIFKDYEADLPPMDEDQMQISPQLYQNGAVAQNQMTSNQQRLLSGFMMPNHLMAQNNCEHFQSNPQQGRFLANENGNGEQQMGRNQGGNNVLSNYSQYQRDIPSQPHNQLYSGQNPQNQVQNQGRNWQRQDQDQVAEKQITPDSWLNLYNHAKTNNTQFQQQQRHQNPQHFELNQQKQIISQNPVNQANFQLRETLQGLAQQAEQNERNQKIENLLNQFRNQSAERNNGQSQQQANSGQQQWMNQQRQGMGFRGLSNY